MLVLSRKQDQRIQIGNDIVLTVVRIQGDKVRLGIEAPKGVVVLRGELTESSRLPTPDTSTICENPQNL